jgi:hypothetical protein
MSDEAKVDESTGVARLDSLLLKIRYFRGDVDWLLKQESKTAFLALIDSAFELSSRESRIAALEAERQALRDFIDHEAPGSSKIGFDKWMSEWKRLAARIGRREDGGWEE